MLCYPQVIQPVFNLMAEQVCLMGDSGEAPALRLGYDDFNESACMPQVGGWGSAARSMGGRVGGWKYRVCAEALAEGDMCVDQEP